MSDRSTAKAETMRKSAEQAAARMSWVSVDAESLVSTDFEDVAVRRYFRSPTAFRAAWRSAISAIVVLPAVVLSCLLSACVVGRHPSGIASETAPLASDYTIIGPVEESSCRSWLFGIPLGAMDSTAEIIDQLVKEKGADALVGVTVEYTSAVFALPLAGNTCTSVKGHAARGVK